jgi:hypothetical protein
MFNSYLINKDAIIASINSSPRLLSLQMKDMERGDLKYKQDNYNLNLECC